MRIDTELTAKDYDAFFVFAALRAAIGTGRRKVWIRLLLVNILICLTWATLVYCLPIFSQNSTVLQALTVIFAGGAISFLWYRHSRRAMLPEQGGILLGPHTLSLLLAGLEDRGPSSYQLTQWQAVQALEETRTHLFIFTDTATAHIVPKRCFPRREVSVAFVQALRTYLPASCHVVKMATSSRRWLHSTALMLAVSVLTSLLLSKIPPLHTTKTHEDNTEDTSSAEWEEGEDLFYSQAALMEKQTKALLPERPGVVDSYFVGFGGDAEQDVFMKEALYAQKLFDRQYDTRGRSIVLLNNTKTKKEIPIASSSNLRATLRYLGQHMNREEDILFLFLTSHGSRDHVLSVERWPLPLRGLSSTALAEMLKESGITWRVILISACYSGGFIDALKDDHSLIMTSASATRTSFGCGDDDELTYFGRAFLQDQLEHGVWLLPAFSGAVSLIQQRESTGKLKASNPQLSSSPAILEKVKKLEARLVLTKPH